MPGKMKFETSDGTVANIAKLAELFPSAVTEGKVNFDLLRTLLGDEVFGDEAYEFTWVGKRAAIAEAGRPIRKTLRPCVEESKDWDTTENLYIEGDNLDVLKLLQESYLGKVKMIYIDPPYNTGSDFIYRDDFAQSREEYEADAGIYDEDGDCLFRNTETNGRFHSDWCSMVYPRLVLARNLLHDDGTIFISIDDNEQGNLKKICDEIFGASNFVAQLIWQKIHSTKNDAKYFSENHEYLLVYAKSIMNTDIGLLERTADMNARYKNPDNDPRGSWQSGDLVASGERNNGHYPVVSPKTGKIFDVPQGKHWVYSEENMTQLVNDNQIWFGADGNAFPRKKRFLKDVQDGRKPNTLWLSDEVGHNQSATREVIQIFEGDRFFDFPKPAALLKRCVSLQTLESDVILDFFSGSATTAHAVMQLNAEDGGKRKFIMVQLPEECPPDSEAAKAGYKNICEIGKERIRRAGDKIKADSPLVTADLDIGFRVLKLDDTNMKDVYYSAAEYTQDLVAQMEGNIKDDRTDMDLLFGCLLDWGLPLSFPHTHEVIDDATVHTYSNEGDRIALIACFAKDISDNVVREIAKRKPLRVVFRDSSFPGSPEKINVFEIFKLLAPDTSVKVI
jgi:adenine-specific DNA-methyltransferase